MELGEPGTLIDGTSGEACGGGELLRRIAARAGELARLGARPGDRVALTLENRPAALVDVAAVWRLDACAVPLSPSATEHERSVVLEHARPRLLLSPGREPRALEAPERAPGEALILYTSGTSGKPKGVVHSAAALRAKFEASGRHLGAASWKRALCLLPLQFGHGLIVNSLWPWLGGKELVVMPSHDLGVLAGLGETLDRYEPDFLSSVPSMWRWLLHTGAAPPRRARPARVTCGSARLDPDVWEKARAWLGGAPLSCVYGTSETASWIAGTDGLEPPEDGLVGEGWGCAFEVREAEDGVGTVWARTESLMLGYLDRPDLTRAAVREGWLKTGDLGRLDARGRLHLKGRADDVINASGIKVYPDEVEEALRGCPGVAEACVLGLDHPIYGQEVAAAVVLRGAELAEVQAWADRRLSPVKRPRVWRAVAQLPRTERGKVGRGRVRELFGSAHGRDRS